MAEKDVFTWILSEVFHDMQATDERGRHREGEFRLSNGDLVEVKFDGSGWRRTHPALPVEYAHSGRTSGDNRGWIDHLKENRVKWLIYSHWRKQQGQWHVVGATIVEVKKLISVIADHKDELETACQTDPEGGTSFFWRVPYELFLEAGAKRAITADGVTLRLPEYVRSLVVRLLAEVGGQIRPRSCRVDFVEDAEFAIIDC